MAITLAIAQARLTEYLAAEAAVLSGQEFEIRDRKFKHADLAEIREGIDYWNTKCLELGVKGSRTGRRMRGGTPT